MSAFICQFIIAIFCFSNPTVIEKENKKPLIVYEVFIQSYADSDKNGIGDIQGLISKLDYIQELGANAIWIMPVHPSPSYHKYDITDYYAIHPDYGTMEDMDELIRNVHHKGMKLIMDLVINHTSAEHPWFKASVSSPDNSYHDYYVWRDFDTVQDEINKKQTTFDSDNITQWHQWENEKDRYYAFFWKGMPDLNFDNPAVREEAFKIGKFWLDKGIDGFRLDAARHIFPDDRFNDTRIFWEEFRTKMEAIHPGVMIIGEVWSDPAAIASLFKGIPSLFNFELTKSIPECIITGDARKLMDDYSSISSAYQAAHVPYTDALLLSNHDINRIRSTLGGDITKAKLAASILLTLPGTPYIYYGEEIGMLGMKPDEHLREPFPWAKDATENTVWLQPTYSVSPAVTPLAEQVNDETSIYHYYKKWIQLRMDHPQMANAKLDFIRTDNPHLLSYTLTGSSEKFLVMHNLSGASVNAPIPDVKKILSDPTKEIMGHTIIIEPYSSVLLCLPI